MSIVFVFSEQFPKYFLLSKGNIFFFLNIMIGMLTDILDNLDSFGTLTYIHINRAVLIKDVFL